MKIWETDTFLARWLNDELSPEEKEAFEQSEDYQHYQQIKSTMEQYEAPAYDESAALEEALGRIRKQPKQAQVFSIRAFAKYAVAASLLLAVCLSVYFALFKDEIVTLTASAQQEVDLPDGSAIVVKEGSFIQYNVSDWEEARTIDLKGEAFFEVEKGSPFKVQLEKGDVSVLGTSFNIIESEGLLEVACYTGKVKVEAFDQMQIIEAGQSVRIRPDELEMDTVYLSEPMWIDQIASYKNVKLPLVIQQLEQLYGVKVEGEYDNGLLYTGQFPTDDLEIALELLFGPYNIQYEYNAETKEVRIVNPSI